MDRPEWWPKNPYFEGAMATITSDADYAKAIPDPQLRTAVAWYLSNRAWSLASEQILEAMENAAEQINQAELLPTDYCEHGNAGPCPICWP